MQQGIDKGLQMGIDKGLQMGRNEGMLMGEKKGKSEGIQYAIRELVKQGLIRKADAEKALKS